MSYTVFIQKFKSGEPSKFEFSELKRILSKYGEVNSGESGIEFRSLNGLFEDTTLGKSESDIDGISFHRPNNTNEFRQMAFEILAINGTCFFDQELGFLRTRTTESSEFPEDLIENTSSRIELIESLDQIWPIPS